MHQLAETGHLAFIADLYGLLLVDKTGFAAALEDAVHMTPSTSVVSLYFDVLGALSLLILQG